MSLFNFGKKKEQNPACTCTCNQQTSTNETHNVCCKTEKESLTIKVLGTGCKSCNKQYENAKQAVKELGLSIEVEHITDLPKVMEYGVMSTPALVIQEQVVSMGKILSVHDVINQLKKLGIG